MPPRALTPIAGIVNIDATLRAQLVNRKQFYVWLGRGRGGARLYTDIGRVRGPTIAPLILPLELGALAFQQFKISIAINVPLE